MGLRCDVEPSALTLLEIPAALLPLFWPAERVLSGMCSCKSLRANLTAVECVVLRARKAEDQVLLDIQEIIFASLKRYHEHHMRIRLTAAATPYESATYFRKHCFYLAFQGALDRAIREGLSSSLEHLDLSQNDLGDHGARRLADSLRSCTALSSLSLSYCCIGCDGIAALSTAFTAQHSLRYLDLKGNKFKRWTPGPETLVRLLDNTSQLEHLNLSSILARPERASLLAGAVRHCTALMHLDLSFCKLRGAGGVELARSLPSCRQLTELNVAGNNIGQNAAAQLCVTLSGFPRLQRLDLSRNSIGEQGARQLGQLLEDVPALSQLAVGKNGIGLVGGETMLSRFVAAERLSLLDLSFTSIQTAGAAVLAAALAQHSALTVLNLAACNIQLGGEGASAASVKARALDALCALVQSCALLSLLDLSANTVPPCAMARLSAASTPTRELAIKV